MPPEHFMKSRYESKWFSIDDNDCFPSSGNFMNIGYTQNIDFYKIQKSQPHKYLRGKLRQSGG